MRTNAILAEFNGGVSFHGGRMMGIRLLVYALAGILFSVGLSWAAETAPVEVRLSAAEDVASGIAQPQLRELIDEVLERNPDLSAVSQRARAERLEAPQAGALPDPMLGATAYVATPETRVGPQRLMTSLNQKIPWFGTLGLKKEMALRQAEALDSHLEAKRLALVTEARRLAYEIAYLDALADIVRADRDTLVHYEELARARYASGVGLDQAVIKLQAEITKDDNRLLDVAKRRFEVVASLNALRDRPADTRIPELERDSSPTIEVSLGHLRERAQHSRPEIEQADSEIVAAETAVALARKAYRPDLTIGLTHTWIGPRDDPAGMSQPPPDNGGDVLGISASISLPVRRGKLRAGVEQAAARRTAARERKRALLADIERALGDLVERLRLSGEQLRLFETVLEVQAEQSLRSAEAGYAAGTLGALDLVDAERVLLEVRTGTERARTDYAVALARLEGAVGMSLTRHDTRKRGNHAGISE
jgi:outer membrane protein TolC